MICAKPYYFDHFRCIAGACPDSCCKEWDVQVDEAAASLYRSLPGALGEDLRRVLRDVDGQTLMTIVDGRCPMWQQDGLCRIQAQLGEAALCRTCRDFPRLTHDYGDFQEFGLELSCPEAARWILSAAHAPMMVHQSPETGKAEYDVEAMAVLKSTRESMLSILSDPAYSVPQALALGLMYGYQAQAQLDGAQPQPFDAAAALEEAKAFVSTADIVPILSFYAGLEILTPQWAALLQNPVPGVWQEEYRALARYFVERYWLQAVSDYDLYSRVKFTVVSCLVIHALGGELIHTAQQYSKEIENDADNVDALLDAAYTHSAFTDTNILALLLQ